MKAEFLKLAGVKTDKQFYAKYPDEKSFFKAHPEAKKMIKKAQAGAIMPMMNSYVQGMQNVPNMQNVIQGQMQSPGVYSSTPNYGQMYMNMSTEDEQLKQPQGQQPNTNSIMKGGMNVIGGMFNAANAMKEQKEELKNARMWADVSGVVKRAVISNQFAEKPKNTWIRPDDQNQIANINQLYPGQGVGTNALARNGKLIKKAQNGVDATPTNWYEEGMDKDTYYALKKQLEEAGYKSIAKPEKANMKEMQEINEYQSDSNQISEDRPGGMMGREQMIPEVDAKSPVQEKPSNFDSKSARDNWVQKTGLPWSEAKRLGYTDGSAKDNTKLLSELNDPRFKKENLRTAPPKKSSQTRTPVQHRETPTGKLTPIKKAMTLDDFYKSKGWNTSKKYQGPEFKQDTRGSYQRELDAKRSQAEYNDQLDLELPLYYLANPGKAFGDFKNWLNPNTPENETSEPFRKQVMSNRYNKSISDKERSARHRQMGYDLVPEAAVNTAAVLAATPYTTFETMPLGIGQGAAPRAAGYVGQGAARLNQAAPKMLNQATPRMLSQPYTPNFVMYEDGGMIGGNPTEIQNTYGDGNSIYDDLGYTPLMDVNQQKSFYHGGNVPRAEFGIASAGMEGFGQNPYSSLTGSMFNNSGGSQMGSAVGSMFGPVGGLAGGMIGGMLDKTGGKTKDAQQRFQRNMDYVAGIDSTAGIHNQFNSVMEDGGWVSNDWNPQVITKFGDLDDQDYAQFAHKDEFRAGGHLKAYREPNESAFNQSAEDGTALDGSLEPMWGGKIKDVSYNPYIGNMAMGFGNNHNESDGYGNTGIGMKVLDDGGEVTGEVEIETKEPMFNTGDSVTVLGARTIPKQLKLDLNIKKGNTFKKVGEEIGKQDNKINKKKEKLAEEYSKIDALTPFDKLKQSSTEMMIKGLEEKQKINANILMGLSSYQNDSEEISNSLGYEDVNKFDKDLEKGKLNQGSMMKNAKFGTSMSKAQNGEKVKFNSEKEALAAGYTKGTDGKYYKITPPEKLEPIETKVAEAQKEIPLQHKDAYGVYGGASAKLAQTRLNNPWFNWEGFNPANEADVKRFQKQFNERAKSIGSSASLKEDGLFGDQTASALIDEKRKVQPSVGRREEAEVLEPNTQPVSYKRNELLDAVGQILPFIRPTDQEPLDPRQLAPEMLAKLQNKLEPVNMQKYNPMLDDLYDISYQDVLNENDSDFLTATRSNNLNPAMRASLLAQKYGANSKVLAEQFRANQSMRDKVFSGNRATLNNAQMTNLGLADQQYQRQQQALSNTKATDLEIAKSYADKYAKNKLENRTLGVYENLYNYRYDKSGRAINMNAPFQPNIPTVASNNGTQRQIPVYEADGKTIKYYQLEEYDPNDTTEPGSTATPGIVAKTGKSIKKNNKNSSIVKAIKNL
jgi:hypothetical protein